MAKRRTKKDRLLATSHRQNLQQTKRQVSGSSVAAKSAAASFLSQDPRLIKADLKKTVLVALVVLLVLFIIALLYT